MHIYMICTHVPITYTLLFYMHIRVCFENDVKHYIHVCNTHICTCVVYNV